MGRNRQIGIVAALLVLAAIVQAIVIERARVPSLDAVRFVGIAQAIDQQGLVETLRTEPQQPLFPVWVWTVHRASGGAMTWVTSVQLAAAIPVVLSIVPLYLLLMRLVGTAAATAGTLFYCLLPEVARLGADGISDSTHLLFFCTAALPLAALQRPTNPRWLLLAGIAIGLALLTRLEIVVLLAAWAIVAMAGQLSARHRITWRRLTAQAACLALGMALVLGPYLLLVGDTTPQAALARVMGRAEAPEPVDEPIAWQLPTGEPAAFDAKESGVSLRQRGYAAAVVTFCRKLADAYGYWIGALALFGAWRLRHREPTRADRLIQTFFILFTIAAVRFTAAEGYLTARHLLPLVVVGLGSAGFGALELGRYGSWVGGLGATGGLPTSARNTGGQATRGTRPHALAWTMVLLAAVACLPQTLIHYHESRRGHRLAGRWLAESALPGAVLDTRGWAGLYSGRATYRFDAAQAALRDPSLQFVVIEARELAFDSARGRTLRWLTSSAEPLAEFPESAMRRPNQEPVLIYRFDPDRTLPVRVADRGT